MGKSYRFKWFKIVILRVPFLLINMKMRASYNWLKVYVMESAWFCLFVVFGRVWCHNNLTPANGEEACVLQVLGCLSEVALEGEKDTSYMHEHCIYAWSPGSSCMKRLDYVWISQKTNAIYMICVFLYVHIKPSCWPKANLLKGQSTYISGHMRVPDQSMLIWGDLKVQ